MNQETKDAPEQHVYVMKLIDGTLVVSLITGYIPAGSTDFVKEDALLLSRPGEIVPSQKGFAFRPMLPFGKSEEVAIKMSTVMCNDLAEEAMEKSYNEWIAHITSKIDLPAPKKLLLS